MIPGSGGMGGGGEYNVLWPSDGSFAPSSIMTHICIYPDVCYFVTVAYIWYSVASPPPPPPHQWSWVRQVPPPPPVVVVLWLGCGGLGLV